MLNNDYNKQYERRQRIKKTTLVTGIDIGADFNAVGFMNKYGNVLGRLPKVYNSRDGFNKFVRMTEELKMKHAFKDVLIGLEPTGHYWRKIAYFAKDQGYAVRFIRTTSLKHGRELNESSSAKSDIKDALTLTNLTREGRYIDTVIEDGVARQLRTLSKVREKIQKQNTGAKNMLHAVLDDYFLELKKLFYAMNTKGLWAILETCPFPEDVLNFENRQGSRPSRAPFEDYVRVEHTNVRLWKSLCPLPHTLRRPRFSNGEAVYVRQLAFLPIHEVKTIQTLNLLTPHVFPVFEPLKTTLERRQIHTVMQLIVDLKKMQRIAVPLNNQYVTRKRLIVASALLYVLRFFLSRY